MSRADPHEQERDNSAKDNLPDELMARLNTLENELNESGETQEQNTSSVSRRRSSVATNKSGLTFRDLPSSIPPPIPESLPTTPGYELSQRMFENSLVAPSIDLPVQQRPKLVKDSTTKSFTRLLRRSSSELPPKITDDRMMTVRNPPKNFYRFLATCLWNFTCGLSDGALGPILPKIEAYYNISYGIVALIWLGNAIGYIVIAFTGHHLDNHMGIRKMATLSCALFALAFAIICSGTKFPVICVAYFFAGLGGGIGLSQYNIFLSRLQNPSKYLGCFHGSYGVGAFIAPIIGTVMVSDADVVWHYYYFIPLAAALSNMLFSAFAFKGCEEDLKKWEDIDNDDHDIETPPVTSDNEIRLDYIDHGDAASVAATLKKDDEDKHNFKAAMMDMRTWLVCSWIFFYMGAEVSMGGWVVTFLLDYRGGNSKSIGYVSSGFWGGVTIGRFGLTQPLATNFGVRRSIIVLASAIMILDVITWLVPNDIASSVFAAFIGLCIGPLYPMMITLVTRILPRKIRYCSLTLGSAFGSSGGSAVPFAVGMASEYVGTYVLHPLFLGCYAMLLISWILLPNIERKGAIKSLWQRFW